jgi:hypothetical protein
MTEATLAILIGVAQGLVLLPLALYVGVLVSRDLCQRRAHMHVLPCYVAPLAVTAIWLGMGYISAEHILHTVTDSSSIRQLWIVGGFFGLMGYVVTMGFLKKSNRKHSTPVNLDDTANLDDTVALDDRADHGNTAVG